MRTADPAKKALSARHQTPNYSALAANLIRTLSVSSTVLKFASLNDNSVSASVHILAGASIVAPAILDYCFALKRSQLKAPNPHLAAGLLILAALYIYRLLSDSNDSAQTIITRYTLLSIFTLLVNGAANSLNATDKVTLENTEQPGQAPKSSEKINFVDQHTPFNTNRHLIDSVLSNGCAIAMLGLMLAELQSHQNHFHMYTLAGILTAGMVIGAVSPLSYSYTLRNKQSRRKPFHHVNRSAMWCAIFTTGASLGAALLILLIHSDSDRNPDSHSTQVRSKTIGAYCLAASGFTMHLFTSYTSTSAERAKNVNFCGKVPALAQIPSK